MIARGWSAFVPVDPTPYPATPLVTCTHDRSPRMKNRWRWNVGVTVNDHAPLPGPYSRFTLPSEALPVLDMYSTRPASENPCLMVRLTRNAPLTVDAPLLIPAFAFVGTSVHCTYGCRI